MLLSVATVTWLTVRIDAVVNLTYSDILIAVFLAAFALDRLALRDARLHPAALTAAGFMLVFLAVYLCGFFDLSVKQATTYWAKGVVDWVLHAASWSAHRASRPPRQTAVRAHAPLVRRRNRHLRRLRPGPADRPGRRRYQPRQHRRQGHHVRPLEPERDQRLRAGGRQGQHLPDQRPDRRPQPHGRDALRAAAADAALLAGGAAGAHAGRAAARVPVRRPGADAVAQRGAGRYRRAARPVPADPPVPAAPADDRDHARARRRCGGCGLPGLRASSTPSSTRAST